MLHRLSARSLAIALVLVAGCYSPQLGSPGYYCHEADKPACPDGQKCVNGRCTSGNPTGGGNDFALPVDGGGAHDFATGGSHDLATTSHDLAMQSQPDLSMGMLCMCSVQCSFGCVGHDCCLEQALLMLCTQDPTCTPN